MAAHARDSLADIVIQGELARLRALASALLLLCVAGSIAGAICAAHVLLQFGLGPESGSASGGASDSGSGPSAELELERTSVLYPWASLYS